MTWAALLTRRVVTLHIHLFSSLGPTKRWGEETWVESGGDHEDDVGFG
jgi:hypothetical protein